MVQRSIRWQEIKFCCVSVCAIDYFERTIQMRIGLIIFAFVNVITSFRKFEESPSDSTFSSGMYGPPAFLRRNP